MARLLRQGTRLLRESVSLPVGWGDFRGPGGAPADHSQKSRSLSLRASRWAKHRLLAAPVPRTRAGSRGPGLRMSWAWVPSGAPEPGCSGYSFGLQRTEDGSRRLSGFALRLLPRDPVTSQRPRLPATAHCGSGFNHKHSIYSKHTLRNPCQQCSGRGKGNWSKSGVPRGGPGVPKCLDLDAGYTCVRFVKSQLPGHA